MDMFIQCFLFICLFLSLILPICYSGTEPKQTSGPFKTSIVSNKDCSNPRRPYLKNPPMLYHPSVVNIDGKNMLGGNLTVLKDTKDFKVSIKRFVWRNGKWHQTHIFNNLNCHDAVLRFAFAATRVKYNKNNCMILKGVYVFQNLDANPLAHIWFATMPYGHVLWRFETFSKDGIFFCKEFDTVAEPA